MNAATAKKIQEARKRPLSIREIAKKPVKRCPSCFGLVVYRTGGQPCAWCGVMLPEISAAREP